MLADKRKVAKDWKAIEQVENPPEALQFIAVQQNPEALRLIKNPTEAIKLSAVSKKGELVECVSNPSEEVQLAAVIQNPDALFSISSPCVKAQAQAVKLKPALIKCIRRPCEDVQVAAVMSDWYAISYINLPTERVQKIAYGRNREAVRFIRKLCPEIEASVRERYSVNSIPTRHIASLTSGSFVSDLFGGSALIAEKEITYRIYKNPSKQNLNQLQEYSGAQLFSIVKRLLNLDHCSKTLHKSAFLANPFLDITMRDSIDLSDNPRTEWVNSLLKFSSEEQFVMINDYYSGGTGQLLDERKTFFELCQLSCIKWEEVFSSRAVKLLRFYEKQMPKQLPLSADFSNLFSDLTCCLRMGLSSMRKCGGLMTLSEEDGVVSIQLTGGVFKVSRGKLVPGQDIVREEHAPLVRHLISYVEAELCKYVYCPISKISTGVYVMRDRTGQAERIVGTEGYFSVYIPSA